MPNSSQGFIVIADISGYTAYLSQSELAHAEDSLNHLLKLIIDHTKIPLVISRLEGDSVISYTLDGSYLQSQTIVEMIEQTYVAFKRAIELMTLNTTCTCNACRNIPNLDLKFFIHHGTFMLQAFPAYVELIGNDVNLTHRLTKNRVVETTGIQAYALYTQAAIDGLEIHELSKQMTPHTEIYEHIGEVGVYIQDMHLLWENERSRLRVRVPEADAVLTMEKIFPVPKGLMWDYLTKPEYKAILQGSDSVRVDNHKEGRIGDGAVYYCAHGKNISAMPIVDWQPPEEYTTSFKPLPGTYGLTTVQLFEEGEQTRVRVLASKLHGGPLILQKVGNVIMKMLLKRDLPPNLENLHKKISEELEQGLVVQPLTFTISPLEIKKSIAKSLSGDNHRGHD